MNEEKIEAIKGLNAEKEILTRSYCENPRPALAARLSQIDREIIKILSNPIS